LDEKDKIVLISHVDLDGITSAKVVNAVVNADNVKILQYDEVDEKLAEKLKIDGYTKIIISDMYVEREEILKAMESFAEILILDHHPSKDWNSDKTTHLKAEEGYCAAYFCYSLFNKVQNIEKLDWLVASACIADFCNVKNREWIKAIFEKYGIQTGGYMNKLGFAYDDISKSEIYRVQWDLGLAIIFFRDNLKRVFESIGESFGDIGDLKEHSSKIEKEVERAMDEFEEKRIEFEGGYFFVFNPRFNVGGLVSTMISTKYPDKTIMILSEKENGYSISARRQDGNVDLGLFLKQLLQGLENARGGGHRQAAGAYFMKKDLPEITKRIGLQR